MYDIDYRTIIDNYLEKHTWDTEVKQYTHLIFF